MYAVFMDYEYEGRRNTVILGGSVAKTKIKSFRYLERMADETLHFDGDSAWYVDEDDLPHGYRFQTYYVSSYDPAQTMIGVS